MSENQIEKGTIRKLLLVRQEILGINAQWFFSVSRYPFSQLSRGAHHSIIYGVNLSKNTEFFHDPGTHDQRPDVSSLSELVQISSMWSCFNGSLFELVYLQLPYCSDVKGELESFRGLFRRIRILMGPAENSRTLSCRTFVSPGYNQI